MNKIKINCLTCKKEMLIYQSLKAKKYCSRVCHYKNKKVYFKCLHCKTELTDSNTYPSVRHYCKHCQYKFSRIAQAKWKSYHPIEYKAQALLNTFRMGMLPEERLKTNRLTMEKLLKNFLNTTCKYCKEQLTLKNISLDHIVPRSRNGSNIWENIQLICRICNGRKASLTHDEFVALLTFLQNWPDMKGIILARMAMAGIVYKRQKCSK